MNKPFFVIFDVNGVMHPILKENGDIAQFATKKEARAAIENTSLGDSSYCYDIFKLGQGEYP